MKIDSIFRKKSDWVGFAYVALIVLFLSALFCYAMTLNEGYRQVNEKNITLNRSCIIMDDNEFATGSARQAIEDMDGVTEVRVVSDRSFGVIRDSSDDSAQRIQLVPRLEIEGASLVGKKEPWRICWFDEFPRAYDLELEKKGLPSALVAGRYAEEENEAVCAIEILREYGIEEPQSALGRKITLTKTHGGETRVCEKTIVGVVNERIREISLEGGTSSLPTLYLSTKDVESITLFFGSRPNYCVYFDSHESKVAGLSRLREILPEGCFVVSEDESFGVGGLAQQRRIVIPILSAVCALLCAGLWFAFLLNVTRENQSTAQLSEKKSPVVSELIITIIKSLLATALGLALGALVIFGAAHIVSAAAGWQFCGNYKLLLGALGIDLGVGALLSASAAWATHLALKKRKE